MISVHRTGLVTAVTVLLMVLSPEMAVFVVEVVLMVAVSHCYSSRVQQHCLVEVEVHLISSGSR